MSMNGSMKGKVFKMERKAYTSKAKLLISERGIDIKQFGASIAGVVLFLKKGGQKGGQIRNHNMLPDPQTFALTRKKEGGLDPEMRAGTGKRSGIKRAV